MDNKKFNKNTETKVGKNKSSKVNDLNMIRASQGLEEVLATWKKESGLKGIIQFSKYVKNGVLGIFVSSPGIMIGKNGILIKKFLPALQVVQPEILSIKFYETHNWFIN